MLWCDTELTRDHTLATLHGSRPTTSLTTTSHPTHAEGCRLSTKGSSPTLDFLPGVRKRIEEAARGASGTWESCTSESALASALSALQPSSALGPFLPFEYTVWPAKDALPRRSALAESPGSPLRVNPEGSSPYVMEPSSPLGNGKPLRGRGDGEPLSVSSDAPSAELALVAPSEAECDGVLSYEWMCADVLRERRGSDGGVGGEGEGEGDMGGGNAGRVSCVVAWRRSREMKGRISEYERGAITFLVRKLCSPLCGMVCFLGPLLHVSL